MRILPIALFESDDSTELIERAEQSSAVTHGHPRSRLVCALYCLVAARLLSGEVDRKSALRSAIAKLEAHRGERFRKELDLIVGFSEPRGSGYVVDTFWSAWTAFESTMSYAACVRNAISFGGDTDTTACVAGGLAGIYWGVSGIPGSWLAAMRGRGVVTAILSRFLEGRAT
jgi:ADP-ribosylglycohydrolase